MSLPPSLSPRLGGLWRVRSPHLSLVVLLAGMIGLLGVGARSAEVETAPPPRAVAADGDPLPPGAVARIGTGRFRVGRPYPAALTPDGRRLLVGRVILDANTGLEVGRIPDLLPDGGQVDHVTVSTDGGIAVLFVTRKDGVPADGSIVLWELRKGDACRTLPRPLMGHPHTVVSATPDGSRLLALDAYRSLVLWTDLDTTPKAVPLGKTEGGSWYDGPRLTTDGKFVVDVGPKVRLWDAATGKLAREFDGPKGQTVRWAVSPDGKQFAAISGPSIPFGQDKGETTYRVSQWDLAAGRETRQLTERLTTRAVRSGDTLRLLFTPDGGSVLVLDDDGAKQQYLVRRWAVADGKASPEWAIPMSSGYGNIPLLAPDGKTLYHVAHSGVRTFDLDKGIETSPDDLRAGGDYLIGLAADDTQAVTLRRLDRLAYWDLASGRLLREEKPLAFLSRYDFPRSFSRDLTLVSVDTVVGPKNDRDTVVYDRVSGREVYRLRGERCGTFSPDGKHLLTLSPDYKAATVSEANTGELVRAIPCAGDDNTFLSPDGSTFSRPRRTSTQVHSATTGEMMFDGKAVLPEHLKLYSFGSMAEPGRGPFDEVVDYAIGPGGKSFAVAAVRGWGFADGKRPPQDRILLFDTAGKKRLWEANPVCSPKALAVSPDGAVLAVGGRRVILLLDAATGKQLRRYEGLVGDVGKLRFTRDSKRLLASDGDGTIWVWDATAR